MSLEVIDLSCGYEKHEKVLKNVSFKINYGEVLSILGPNGVGKSTLFKCILGFIKYNEGKCLVDGVDFQTLSAKDLAKKVAYIPQNHIPSFNYSVFDIVLMGTTLQTGIFKKPDKQEYQLVEDVLKQLDIYHLRNRSYMHISGGERQLVIIARAIAQKAKILVMDEPSANLDFGNRIKVMQTIRKLANEGYIIIQSTHEPEQAFMYSDKILALHNGEVLAFGNPQDIIKEDIISSLYNVDINVFSLNDDKIRICVEKE